MTKKFLVLLIGAAFVCLAAGGAFAVASDDTVLTYNIEAINEITVGAIDTLTVSTATAGQEPDVATDASFAYDVTTNATGKTIQASLSAAMPAYVTLTLNLTAIAPDTGETAGTSKGAIVFAAADTTVAKALLSGMANIAGSSTGSAKITALAAATIAASVGRTITFTIVGDAI